MTAISLMAPSEPLVIPSGLSLSKVIDPAAVYGTRNFPIGVLMVEERKEDTGHPGGCVTRSEKWM